MIDKSAIQAIQLAQATEAAFSAMKQAEDTQHIVALPDSFTTVDLERYQPTRRRARGTMSTASVDSFLNYTTAHAEDGASIFINQEEMAATAVLNLGSIHAPGHADNQAALKLKKTAAYAALMAHTGGAQLKQSQVAEFLEDWADHVECSKDGEPVPLGKAIAAVRKITIDAMRKIENTEQQLSASRSAFESVQATSTEPLPTSILFSCQPYADLSRRTFTLRMGILTGGDKPAITLRIANLESQQEEMAQELSELIIEKLPASQIEINVLLGQYRTV